MNKLYLIIFTGMLCLLPVFTYAADDIEIRNFTAERGGFICIFIFCLAYCLVIAEEKIHMRKSKPVIVGAGLIWFIVAWIYAHHGDSHTAEEAIRGNLLEFSELFFFLLAAMTYINTMEDRGVFDALRGWLISRKFSLRLIYCITGALAFFISPVADNLTTALLMSAVVMAVGKSNTRFVTLACINIVVAANAGGAYSPFGDITTLMVWQKGDLIEFQQFFCLFLPSAVNWLVPAAILFCFLPAGVPDSIETSMQLKPGALIVIGLFIVTIVMSVLIHMYLNLPPVIGMMTGLGFLKLFCYVMMVKCKKRVDPGAGALGVEQFINGQPPQRRKGEANYKPEEFNIFKKLARAEWDTLMFFYGVMLCVGGLSTLGYLELVSGFMYQGMGATNANILVGLLSAIIDNIPIMFAVLSMLPDMSTGHWLLVTMTAGVGGSLLSIGSAAGVAVMGQARGIYTFMSHLKWSWAILLGYAASIWIHFLINNRLFH